MLSNLNWHCMWRGCTPLLSIRAQSLANSLPAACTGKQVQAYILSPAAEHASYDNLDILSARDQTG